MINSRFVAYMNLSKYLLCIFLSFSLLITFVHDEERTTIFGADKATISEQTQAVNNSQITFSQRYIERLPAVHPASAKHDTSCCGIYISYSVKHASVCIASKTVVQNMISSTILLI